MTVYDLLFLCACLLRVYRCVHASQLCININWLPLYYQKGLKLQTANNNLSVETKYVLTYTAVQYFSLLPIFHMSLSFPAGP